MREVVSEYGDDVILNEYPADNKEILQKYGITRMIYVNGNIIELGSEIEKEVLRNEIENARIKIKKGEH